jgi:tetratricopeptide (TPR) repeat protein
MAADPDNESLPDYLGNLLVRVGRVEEGVNWIDRSVKLDPLSGPKTESLIDALAGAGRLGDADKLIERAGRLWPDDINLRRSILFKGLIYAAPAQALAVLDRFQAADRPLPAERARVWRDFEKARAGQISTERIEKRLAAVNSNSEKGPDADNTSITSLYEDERNAVIVALASLGDRDDAFRTLDLSRSMHVSVDPSILFEPATQSLRGDSRFTKVAADLGLVRYWASVKRKPDFCTVQPAAKVCS